MRIRERQPDGKYKAHTIELQVRLYTEKIKVKDISIDNVPEKYKDKVEKLVKKEVF